MKRASWGAIFAGAFIALAVMTLLGTLGVAIGAMTIDPATGDTPSGRTFAIGAGIWWLVSGLIALFAGGWVAGRLAGLRRRYEGPLHGIVTWALTTAAMLALATTVMGTIISGAMGVVSAGAGVASEAGQVVGEAAPEGAQQDIRQEVQQRGQQAEQAIREVQKEPEQAQEAAAEAAETAAQTVSRAAWVSFFYLLLTAIAAGLGGLLGAPKTRAPGEPTRRKRTEEGPRGGRSAAADPERADPVVEPG